MADQKIKSWEKLVQNVGTKYSQDINSELNRKFKVNLVTPLHLTKVLVRHDTKEELVHMGKSRIQSYRWVQAIMLRSAATGDPSDVELQ